MVELHAHKETVNAEHNNVCLCSLYMFIKFLKEVQEERSESRKWENSVCHLFIENMILIIILINIKIN